MRPMMRPTKMRAPRTLPIMTPVDEPWMSFRSSSVMREKKGRKETNEYYYFWHFNDAGSSSLCFMCSAAEESNL